MSKRVLSETGLKPCYLELEITESIAMQHLSLTISVFKELQVIGVDISLDDFGTRFKIDRELVKDLPLILKTLLLSKQMSHWDMV